MCLDLGPAGVQRFQRWLGCGLRLEQISWRDVSRPEAGQRLAEAPETAQVEVLLAAAQEV
jgi:hypothetical protein